jgi:tetratricopeptide (TPR) repeat protein
MGLTQAQVAARTASSPWQLSRAAVSAIERGQNFPGLEAMLALSNVLHIDPKELIERARLSAVVPVDVTGLTDDELEARASQFFWAGRFQEALAVYDAMVQKLALVTPQREEALGRLAELEIRRATTLKRIGALISAIASIERAISLASTMPALQVEAYVVLADLQGQRGHLPLARDAAERAVDLASRFNPRRLTWALMVKAKGLFLGRQFEDAKRTFLEAERQAQALGDHQHASHLAGNIGNCSMALGDHAEAWSSMQRAVRLARDQQQPALEASWLVELGKIALERGDLAEASRAAGAALALAQPLEHNLTVFRAEWLGHRLALRGRPDDADEERMERLRRLFPRLDAHAGIEEIVEFERAILRTEDAGGAQGGR